MLWVFQGIFVADVEPAVMHIVHNHVHAAKVVGGGVALLPVKTAHLFYLFGHTQQQRTRTAGGIVHTFEFVFSGGNDFGQHRTHLLRGIKLPGLFSGTTGKLPDEVLVGIAQHIAVAVFQPEIDLIEVFEYFYNQLVFRTFAFA